MRKLLVKLNRTNRKHVLPMSRDSRFFITANCW